jgi:biopolymer transport protein ExbB
MTRAYNAWLLTCWALLFWLPASVQAEIKTGPTIETQAIEALREINDQLEARLRQLEGEDESLKGRLDEAQVQLEALKTRHGDLPEALRQAAENSLKHLGNSLLGPMEASMTQRLEQQRQQLSKADQTQMDLLWKPLLAAIQAQGRIGEQTARLIEPNGQVADASIRTLGPFVALNTGRFLEYKPELGAYQVLARQPADYFLEQAKALERPEGARPLPLVIDPTRGAQLAVLVQTPDLMERIEQGGLVGYIIMALAAFGIGLALLRIAMLRWTWLKVARQKRQLDRPRLNNPLGRVLLALKDADPRDSELLERKLDEAVLRELPALEWGLGLVKLLAAIAPLLGLLGTVVGMILTFQAISLFGSGDPKMMAGGISQALVTTIQGLVTAIPLLLLHALALSSSRRLTQVLDEQSAALLAQQLEAQRRA